MDQYEPCQSALDKMEPETGTWFLDSKAFQKWLTVPASLLWLHGSGMSVSPNPMLILICTLQSAAGRQFFAPLSSNEFNNFVEHTQATKYAIFSYLFKTKLAKVFPRYKDHL
jgi:hypothetical protein